MQKLIKLSADSEAVRKLSSADRKLAALIEQIGDLDIVLRNDYVASVIRAIVGQQLSVKAARTIWHRVEELCGTLSPEALIALDDEELRAAGLSRGKITYVRDFCKKVLSGEIDFATLCSREDACVIETLTRVKGIGQWTAEMFLIFSLGRPDILSVKDAGLQRAIQWLYGLEQIPTAEEMMKLGEMWKPHRSAASLYLWEALNRGLDKTAIR